MTRADTHRAVEAVWRIEAGRVIAGVARLVGDVGLAEELAQDALLAALEQWPAEGVPRNPGAWLMTTAKRRAIDQIRRRERFAARMPDLLLPDTVEGEFDAVVEDTIEDDLLRLIFTACHPVLGPEARVALTLRMLGGLSTDEIARAFLVPGATVGQRISRAKKTLAEAKVPFEVPDGAARTERLASVLEVIYLIFNEGYSATAGDDWMRPALCEEAMRLGRVLAGLMPGEAEVHGLVALMEIQASRSAARTGPSGEPVVLLEQDRGRWDRLLIRRGLAALDRAEELGGGTYTLQAAIAACHARAATAADTDWHRIAELYARHPPSPVVELNRAVAVAMADGPAAGLAVLDPLLDEPSLRSYHLLPTVRADLLLKLGRRDEARAEFERAAAMTRNEAERGLLLARAEGCR
ncbi:RNA polymerase sigma factor [Dactylosporangium aurantiacum]|uniref:RNA polymerase sigma factor n=1 Tax=Dactylosporangium aurantiacum TaxID=35754 RepID=A0A9Q9IKF8_9ACTN|nr:RNA polymerase sigma factor [Dactylosporangium aurantiacum]MDG6104718.1 RNA polymerase sigma factor [Dactylosporangium aurantiacum]UWZ55715.1 RNA polymerase sigma factor [Dactylosporangium aurantiacum]